MGNHEQFFWARNFPQPKKVCSVFLKSLIHQDFIFGSTECVIPQNADTFRANLIAFHSFSGACPSLCSLAQLIIETLLCDFTACSCSTATGSMARVKVCLAPRPSGIRTWEQRLLKDRSNHLQLLKHRANVRSLAWQSVRFPRANNTVYLPLKSQVHFSTGLVLR